MADSSSSPPSRPMKYPYTITAKVAQFPLKFHLNVTWYYKYFLFGALATFPVFMKINSLANSPANQAKTAARKAKVQKEAEEHLAHLH